MNEVSIDCIEWCIHSNDCYIIHFGQCCSWLIWIVYHWRQWMCVCVCACVEYFSLYSHVKSIQIAFYLIQFFPRHLAVHVQSFNVSDCSVMLQYVINVWCKHFAQNQFNRMNETLFNIQLVYYRLYLAAYLSHVSLLSHLELTCRSQYGAKMAINWKLIGTKQNITFTQNSKEQISRVIFFSLQPNWVNVLVHEKTIENVRVEVLCEPWWVIDDY